VQPWTVEKDFFLTRLIWGLSQAHGDSLLLKGGTCLSKVDLGYHRMSEDVDLTLCGVPTKYRSTNSSKINPIVRTLRDGGEAIGAGLMNFDGDRSEKDAHGIWELHYQSSFLDPKSAIIAVEVAIRTCALPARRAQLLQLLPSDLASGYAEAYCWALDFAEVRAEKVRAAYTREEPAIRDYYDLDLFAKRGLDMSSPEFERVVDGKLAEVGALPLREQPASFGLDKKRRSFVEAARPSLTSVLRLDEDDFDLQGVLSFYDRLWKKS